MVRTYGVEPDPAKRIRKRQGQLIRETRELHELSIDEFAELLSVSPGAVSHWETGRYTPRQHHQVAIAKTLNVTWNSIFGLDAA